MIELFQSHNRVIAHTQAEPKRSLYLKLPWKERAIKLMGARGTGKSTLFLQYIKENYTAEQALYITLDDIYFRQNTLVDTARTFMQSGGELLVIDEVHKYEGWSREVKNIYDLMPSLKMLITGSSILEMQKADADLSRRFLDFQLPELSFREYLLIAYGVDLPFFSMGELLKNHTEIARVVKEKVEFPLMHFKEFLKTGAYPFFKETDWAENRLRQTINLIIDTDIPNAVPVEFSTLNQLKKLLYIIAQSVPFKPNVTKLAEQTSTSRPKLYEMLKMLEAARLIYNLHHSNTNVAGLAKPEKIFLHNAMLNYALSEKEPEIGTIRESFFINMLDSARHQVHYTEKGDFLIDQKYIFEIGGRNKTTKQIQGIENGFLALDDIESGAFNTIPLWLFGFLY